MSACGFDLESCGQIGLGSGLHRGREVRLNFHGHGVGANPDCRGQAVSTGTEVKPELDTSLTEVLASVLGLGIVIYDKNDILQVASSEVRNFFPAVAGKMVAGARLRDVLGAAYDCEAFAPVHAVTGRAPVSREDWIAERLALHWRERYESLERLPDGRIIRMTKRRLPSGVLITTIADVSDSNKQDLEVAELRKQAELSHQTLAALTSPVMVKDASLRYLLVNDAFCRLLGLHPKKLIGRKAADVVDPERALHYELDERRVLETGVPVDSAEEYLMADGTLVRSVARKRRFGSPGNYRLLVMFDGISAFGDPDRIAGIGEEAVAAAAKPELGAQPQQDHVLVLDEIPDRAEAGVAALKAAGSDALAIHSARDALTFLAMARSMGVVIDQVQASPGIAEALAALDETGSHPVLVNFLKAARSPEPDAVRPAADHRTVVWPPVASPLSGQNMDHSPGLTARPFEAADAGKQIIAVTANHAQSSLPPAATEPAPRPAQADAPSSRTETPPAFRAAVKSRRIRVLVAEDNDVNQIVFEQILEGIGVDYRIVGNGQLALEAWRSASPDIILMDVSMPVMNGLQATQAIRAAEIEMGDNDCHVPIIAVTAHAMSGDRDRCFAAGMDDYLSKPVSPEKLEAAIRTWIDDPNLILASAGQAG